MPIRLSSKFFPFVIAAVAVFAGMAGAQPEPWVHPDGSIHYFHALSTPGGLNWNFAWDSALGHGGYLATITSQAENDFVFGLVDSSIYWHLRPNRRLAGPWLGGTQDFGSHEPDSGWHWVTGESMDYVNWSPGQPDNNGNANALHFGLRRELLAIGVASVIAVGLAWWGWPALARTLVVYGFAARIPVALVMLAAIFGNWGTHYDVVPPEAEYLNRMAPVVKWFWIGLLPQMTSWMMFTVVIGMLVGAVAVALVKPRPAAAA